MSVDRQYLIDNEELPQNYLVVPDVQVTGTHARTIRPIGEGSSINNSERTVSNNSKKFPQYIAAISATISAAAAGAVLGWTSPITTDIKDGKYNKISVTDNELAWIGSFVTLGAILSCFPSGIICNIIGRKSTLLLLLAPFTIGWAFIIWANSVFMIYVGRFLTGIASGACCVAAPLYTCEIAQKEVRGALGSYFQLMVTVGILFAYVIGKCMDPWHYTIVCATLPFLFFFSFIFQPETPHYCLSMGRPEKARSALLQLRGKNYDTGLEMDAIKSALDSLSGSYSFNDNIRKRTVVKAFIISLSLMFFQQMSGINAVVFYATDIFKDSGSKIDPKTASIVVALVQVLATILSSLLVDRLGRRILLISSGAVMALSSVLLGVFFTLKMDKIIGNGTLTSLGFLPVTSLCIFVTMYSVGLGPIPWMISSEIFSSELKSIASSVAGTFSWFLAFLVTKFFLELETGIGEDVMFYLFALMSLLGTTFVYFVVPETKGKTIDEVQHELEN
ncbi:facilitated trehalose transporter Tret1 [Agrilus planipennis]|uniref:Facilitated trehalose transporter Tret1 n=1 Tax=Agrilus planipennis TaxID=224129 RepID=A0A1W4WXN8_AGRPL|nr:facilitated trehalose transporter Tret1 [Agrilus planipennis]XP_018325287.1 facilitated trehalose transporter Tret1 [Agrilus planipennis]